MQLRWQRYRSYTIHRGFKLDGPPEFHVGLAVHGQTRLISVSAMNATQRADGDRYLDCVAITVEQAVEQLRWMRSTGLHIIRYTDKQDQDPQYLTHHCQKCGRVVTWSAGVTAHEALLDHYTAEHESLGWSECSAVCFFNSAPHLERKLHCRSGTGCRWHGRKNGRSEADGGQGGLQPGSHLTGTGVRGD
jgi:hypothetical protein